MLAGSEQLGGTWERACRWREREGQEGPRGRWKGSLPAPSLTRLWRKERLYSAGGKEGKRNQNSRKGTYFLFSNTPDGTHCTCPARPICTRRQKVCGSLGTGKPPPCARSPDSERAASLRLLLSLHRLLEIKGGSPPTSCWQEEDIYLSEFIIGKSFGEKSFNLSL